VSPNWLPATGTVPKSFYDDEDDAWDRHCAKLMVPTYEAVCGAQSELDELSRPVDGYTDGWGTEGNLG
jgi:hypothetical protein